MEENGNYRLERIIRKLSENNDLINGSKKGSIEIHFSDTSETVSIKIVV